MSVTRTRKAVVLRLDGELDYATAPDVAGALDELADTAPIVIEAENLTFVDVAGLAPLLAAAARLPPGALLLRNPRPNIIKLVRLLDLTATLVVED